MITNQTLGNLRVCKRRHTNILDRKLCHTKRQVNMTIKCNKSNVTNRRLNKMILSWLNRTPKYKTLKVVDKINNTGFSSNFVPKPLLSRFSGKLFRL